METMETFDLRIPALILGTMLPLISALQLGSSRGGYVLRYVRCLMAYFFVWVLLALGYAFQAAISPFPAGAWASIVPFSTIDKIVLSLRSEYDNIDNISVVVVPACVVAFSLLIGTDTRSRSVNTLRAAFVSLVTLDLFMGTVTGYNAREYIYNIVLDFAGAFLLGVMAPYVVKMAVPLPEAIEGAVSPSHAAMSSG